MQLKEVPGPDVNAALNNFLARELETGTHTAQYVHHIAGHTFLMMQRAMHANGIVFARVADVTETDPGSLPPA